MLKADLSQLTVAQQEYQMKINSNFCTTLKLLFRVFRFATFKSGNQRHKNWWWSQQIV